MKPEDDLIANLLDFSDFDSLINSSYFSNPAFANPYPAAPRYGQDSSYYRPDIPFAPAPSHKKTYSPSPPLSYRPFGSYVPKYPLFGDHSEESEEEEVAEPEEETVHSAPATDGNEKSEYSKLYPFLGITGFDLSTKEDTKPKETHMDATPEECDVCAGEKAQIAKLEDEIAWLRAQLYRPSFYSGYGGNYGHQPHDAHKGGYYGLYD